MTTSTLDPALKNTIMKIAGAPIADLGQRIVDDFIKGAQRNPRLGSVQHAAQAEVKLAAEGINALDIAHMVGTLKALNEAGFSKKEAAEHLQIKEDAIDAVLAVVAGATG